MMLKLYVYQKCSTCRRAIQWLNTRAIPFDLYPIREEPPSLEALEAMQIAYQGNIKRLINTSSADYRESGLKDSLPHLTPKEAFMRLRQQGNLVKRPFAISQTIHLTGFKEAEWETAFEPISK